MWVGGAHEVSSPGSPQGSGKPPLPVMCLPSCRTQAAAAPAADGGPTLLLLLGTRQWILAGTGAGKEACRHQPNLTAIQAPVLTLFNCPTCSAFRPPLLLSPLPCVF